MQRVALSPARLEELVAGFGQARIAVLGDFFLDKYLDVDPARGEPSVETGKVAHQVIDVRCSPGAAGTVVCNLAALGVGQLTAVGFTGDDGEGYDLRQALTRLGCATEHLHLAADRYTPTYLKPRDVRVESLEAEHSRYDTKNLSPTSAAISQQIVGSLDSLCGDVDAVIVLDQVDVPESGVVTTAVREALSTRTETFPEVIFWADSRCRIREFGGLMIKPNQFEVLGIDTPLPGTEVAVADLLEEARGLRERIGAPVFMTRGSDGMVVSDPDWTLVPGVQVQGKIDPTGAGDSATAGTVLALCAGAELAEAALIGNLVASLTIQQINTTGTARPEQLVSRLAMWQAQQEEN